MAKAKKKARTGISWPVIIALLLLIAGVLIWRGYDYYLLSLEDRVDHPDYRKLRSSGEIGYGYGVAGTLLIFANLLYLARRKFARRNLGSMKTWLDLHVFTGLAGAMFVSFHATFKARSTMSKVTTLSLAVVIITGLIGRFLYALIPSRGDEELGEALDALELEVPGSSAQIRAVLKEHTPPHMRGSSLIRALLMIPAWRKCAAQRRQAIELLVGNAAPTSGPAPTKLTAEVQKHSKQQVRAVAAGAVLRSWRNLHRFFAILMLLSVIFHIGVAWYYGYRWFWSE